MLDAKVTIPTFRHCCYCCHRLSWIVDSGCLRLLCHCSMAIVTSTSAAAAAVATVVATGAEDVRWLLLLLRRCSNKFNKNSTRASGIVKQCLLTLWIKSLSIRVMTVISYFNMTRMTLFSQVRLLLKVGYFRRAPILFRYFARTSLFFFVSLFPSKQICSHATFFAERKAKACRHSVFQKAKKHELK